ADTERDKPLFLQLYNMHENGKSDLHEIFGSGPPQSLTVAKRRLYANILKCLRSLHDDMSVDVIIQNHLSEVEILYNHSLSEQSLPVLLKAYDLANKHEKFGLLLQVLDWERKLNIVLDSSDRTIAEIAGEEQFVLNKLIQIRQLENIYSHAKSQKKL